MYKIEQSKNKALWYVLEKDFCGTQERYFIIKVFHKKTDCIKYIKRIKELRKNIKT